MRKEHLQFSENDVWLKGRPRAWSYVASEAASTNSKVHVGNVFGICVGKGSELESKDPDHKFKGCYVFHGNRVKLDYPETAPFSTSWVDLLPPWKQTE